MATGGIKLDPVTAEERQALKLSDNAASHSPLKHVGQYGEHAAARNAGFQKDDILISFAGSTKPLTETELFAVSE